LLVSYYASQTNGSGMHSPEVCIPAGGWEVSRWGQYNVTLANSTFGQLKVNRAIIQKGQSKQLVYYWFEQRGRHVTSDYWAKAYTVWDSISRGRSDGALVRVVTPIESEAVDVADKRLNQFLNFAVEELPRFVPP
jgi:EpsI family protein